VLDSAQKSGPDGINNRQYFHTFCTFEIPDSWQKSNFQLYLFVYIYTPSEPLFHADSNALIRSGIGAKLSVLLQFFFFANSSNFPSHHSGKWLCAEVMSKKRHNYVSFWTYLCLKRVIFMSYFGRCCVPDMAPQPWLLPDLCLSLFHFRVESRVCVPNLLGEIE